MIAITGGRPSNLSHMYIMHLPFLPCSSCVLSSAKQLSLLRHLACSASLSSSISCLKTTITTTTTTEMYIHMDYKAPMTIHFDKQPKHNNTKAPLWVGAWVFSVLQVSLQLLALFSIRGQFVPHGCAVFVTEVFCWGSLSLACIFPWSTRGAALGKFVCSLYRWSLWMYLSRVPAWILFFMI